VAGATTIDGKLVLDFLNGLAVGAEDVISLLSDTSLTGDFAEVDVLGIDGAYTVNEIRSAQGDQFEVTAVPEPASWGYMAFGVLALFGLRRRIVAQG
jgi:hypothetical protein